MLYCHRAAKKQNVYKWPSGKARMTTVGNISFCFIMMAASIVLIVESIRDVVEHIADKTAANTEPFHLSSLIVVSCAFATKLALMLYCWQHKARNTQIQILWEDHRNDLFINGLGIVTSVLGSKVVWWLDPAGAMFLSLCIIASWGNTAFGEFKLLVGISAGPDFLQLVTYTCVTHHPDIIQVDTCRAYHAGEGIIIEADVIMHESKTLRETHDISEDLQNKLERLPGVERAYVHTDFEASHLPEHRKNV
jgi:divalent metal cation (Fe/Co/Zn/Cd) transporter